MNYGPYFREDEFACRHCGEVKMDQEFIARLNELREGVGFPLVTSSGYRCPEHPVEARKAATGAHTTGKAVDFAVDGWKAYQVLAVGMEMGFKGIGVQQKGAGRFIHLDDWDNPNRPTVWSY